MAENDITRAADSALKRTLAEVDVQNVFAKLQREVKLEPTNIERNGSFADRMRFLKNASKLQNIQLAVAFGVSEGGFKKWLSGATEPALRNLVSIREVTGVALQWVVTGEGPMFDSDTPNGLSAPGYVYVPQYDARAGAGAGQIAASESLKDFLALREDWVRSRLRRNPANLVAMEAYGDSMVPTIADGDVMLVDTSEDRVRGPAVYVVLAGNEAIVKRVELKLDGSIVAKSDNPAYEPIVLRGDQVDHLRVLGKVVWTGGVV